MSSSFHWFRTQKRSFFSPGVMSGWAVNCYHKKTWWLKRGQSSGPPGFQRKMCESILTCATCYIKIHISGFWMLFFIYLSGLSKSTLRRAYRQHMLMMMFSFSCGHTALVYDNTEWGALHLDMSLGLQLTHPSLGNWWELCFHSNSPLLWFVHLGFYGGKTHWW